MPRRKNDLRGKCKMADTHLIVLISGALFIECKKMGDHR